MRHLYLAAATMLALAASACNSNQGGGNDLSTDVNLAEDAAVNDVLGGAHEPGRPAAMPTDAAGFANAAAASDLYEIESSRLARQKANSADVKSLAQMVQREHEGSTAQLKTAAGAAGVTVTPALDAEKQAMLEELEGLSGGAFDKRYMSQQRTAHQKALMLLQNYQGAGDNEALKQYAATAQKLIESHLDRLNIMPI